MLRSGQKHKMGAALVTYDEMIAKATSLNIAPSDVGKRIILKRMFGEVQEVKEAWIALNEAHNDSPPLDRIRAMLDRKVLAFSSIL